MSSTKNTSVNKYSAKSFFRFSFRQNIQQLVLYLIIAVLVIILPTIMAIEDYYDTVGARASLSAVKNTVLLVGLCGFLVSCVIAFLSGLMSLTLVNSKQNIGCYHSFPIRRETMYIIESLTRTIYYGITILFGFIVPYLMLAVTLPTDYVFENFGALLQLLLVSVLAFMLIYAAFLFAAGLTGTAFMRFVMVVVIFFLPVAAYAVIFAMFNIAEPNLTSDYYFSADMIQLICSPVRAFVGVDEMINHGSYLKLLAVIPEAALYYIGGLLLHKYRRTEATGTTIVWKPVFAILKYVIIAVCTLFGAWLFYMIEENALSFAVGAIIGAVVSFILTNALLYRSSKAMFRGLRPFGVCCAVMLVFMLIVPANLTGMIGEYYSASNTKELQITINNIGAKITYTDKEDIEKLLAYLEDEESLFSGDKIPYLPILDPADDPDYEKLDSEFLTTGYSEYYKEYYADGTPAGVSVGFRDDYYSVDTFNLTVTQKPKLGLPLSVACRSDANSDFTAQMIESDEFAEVMNITSWLDTDNISTVIFTLDNRQVECYAPDNESDLYYADGSKKNNAYYQFSYTSYMRDIDGLWDKVIAALEKTDFSAETYHSSPIVGYITVYFDQTSGAESFLTAIGRFSYPIFAEDLELLNAAAELFYIMDNPPEDFVPYSSAEEYYRDALRYIPDRSDLMLLVNCETGETVKLDEDELVKLSRYTNIYFTDNMWNIRYFVTESECKYAILINRDGSYDLDLRFRKGVTDEQIEAAVGIK